MRILWTVAFSKVAFELYEINTEDRKRANSNSCRKGKCGNVCLCMYIVKSSEPFPDTLAAVQDSIKFEMNYMDMYTQLIILIITKTTFVDLYLYIVYINNHV